MTYAVHHQELTLPELYLTPKAVETAQAAGVIAIISSQEQLDGIYRTLAEQAPEELVCHGVKNMLFVARWGGRLNLGNDTHFDYAGMDQPYLNASGYMSHNPAEGFTAANGWRTKQELVNDPRAVIELRVQNWHDPGFGYEVATGMAPGKPKGAAERIPNLSGRVIPGYFDTRAKVIGQAAVEYPHPFSVMMPPSWWERWRLRRPSS